MVPLLSAQYDWTQYDWTTEVPDNGNEWRKLRVIPRLNPLRSLVCSFFGVETERVFRLPGDGGDHFHCRVEPSPGHMQCRSSLVQNPCQGDNFGPTLFDYFASLFPVSFFFSMS